MRFRAKLSAPLPWIVDVYDAAGNAVASSSGTGANVDWTWDARRPPPGSYSYAIRSDGNLTPAHGVLGGGDLSLAIAGLSADPETVSPNDDTISDSTTITYTLNTPANVAVRVVDVLGARSPFPKVWKRAGEHVLRFDPAPLPDGVFRVELAANATGGRSRPPRRRWPSRGRSPTSPLRGWRFRRTPTAAPIRSRSGSRSPRRQR